MNARQFFDVWPSVVRAVALTRDLPGLASIHLGNLEARVATRHGEDAAREAARCYRSFLAALRECGPR